MLMMALCREESNLDTVVNSYLEWGILVAHSSL